MPNFGEVQSNDAALTSFTKNIVIETPSASENMFFFYTTVAVTITEVRGAIVGSTSVDFGLFHGGDRSSTTDSVFDDTPAHNGYLTCNSITEQTFSLTGTTPDPTLPAGSWLAVKTNAISGTPTSLNIAVKFTED